MTTKRANEVLEKATYLTFKERERLSITVNEVSQEALVTLLKMVGVICPPAGTLINIGMKFTKAGECRIKIGQQNKPYIILVVTDAGTFKEFKDKLITHWEAPELTIYSTLEDRKQAIKEWYYIPEDAELEEILPPPKALHTPASTSRLGTLGGRDRGRRSALQTVAIASALGAMAPPSRSRRAKTPRSTWTSSGGSIAHVVNKDEDDLPW